MRLGTGVSTASRSAARPRARGRVPPGSRRSLVILIRVGGGSANDRPMSVEDRANEACRWPGLLGNVRKFRKIRRRSPHRWRRTIPCKQARIGGAKGLHGMQEVAGSSPASSPAVSSSGPGLTTVGGASSTAVWSSSCLKRRSPAKRMHRSWNATDPHRHCHWRHGGRVRRPREARAIPGRARALRG